MLNNERRLFGFVSRWLPAEQAREVVQEGFARLWNQSLADVFGREKAWLFCVCRNLTMNRIKADRKLELDEPVEALDSAAESYVGVLIHEAIKQIQKKINESERKSKLIKAVAISII